MAKYGSNSVAFLLLDGFSVLGQTTTLDDTVTADIEDTTPLGVAWQEQTSANIKRAQINQSGFFDDDLNSVHDALNEKQGQSRILCYGVEGNTANQGFTGYSGAVQVNYARLASVGAVHKANASYQSSGAVDEGIILHALGARTADGNTESTGYDGTAASSAGGAAYLQLTALTLDGHTGLVVSIMDSADDITYAELAAFTAATTAPGAQRVAVAGAVRQYLAAAWDFTGTGTSPTATFMAGLSRY